MGAESGGSGDPPGPTTRLLIADDHDLVRDGLRSMLEGEPDFEVVGEAQNGREAFQLCRCLRPDLVLMDVRMPEMDGLEATRAIKREHPEVGVLVVTMHDNPDYMFEAIKGGAAGYVLKDAPRDELIAAVRRALDGELPMDPDLVARLLRRLADEARESAGEPARNPTRPPFEPELSLTPRELEVLELLAQGQTNGGIARRLVVSTGTVRTHVKRVIAKLGVSDRTQAAVRAFELGIVTPNGR
jgi:two-component system, NarL family, response regulator LiaR